MPTFSELQASVRRRVIDITPDVEAELPSLVNAAVREAQRRNNFNAMRQSFDVLLGDDQSTVSRPDNFKQFRGEPYLSVTESRGGSLRLLDFNAFTEDETLGWPSKGEPRFLVEDDGDRAGDWFVYPTADGFGDFGPDENQYRVRVFYYGFLPTLAGPTDSNWITENADDFVVREACASAFEMLWEEERAIFWRRTAEDKFNIVVTQDRRAVASGKNELRPHEGMSNRHYNRYRRNYLP